MANKKYSVIKRFLDIIISYVLLTICYLPIIAIAVIIKINDGGPVIFRQIRIGIHGKKFVCYKFRTMKTNAPSYLSTNEFTDSDMYITSVGAFLRQTSLDELPQLFNVLAGDMSIVGPRPLIEKERNIHELRELWGVYSIRPGITGLSQICGRDNLSDIRKAECDAIYVENISLKNDIKIFCVTLKRVFKREEIIGTVRKYT